jgi:hypothetical protein
VQLRSLAIGLAVGLIAATAQAATLHFATALKGSDEVPPNTTAGTGQVEASLDTGKKTFSYKVTYSGLTGAAMAAHFHGPAAPGANAPPVIPIGKLASPMTGSAQLTDAQAADLTAGKWYFNIHTAAHPSGEIRGQLTSAP